MNEQFDLNNTKRYSIWACYAAYPDKLVASNFTEWSADEIVTEINLVGEEVGDLAEYRYCEATEEEIAADKAGKLENFESYYKED